MTADVYDVAWVCHEANRAWCAANGDRSQVAWEEAEPWQRDSAVQGVYFAIANPDAPASAQHEAWWASKIADGWVYGPVKDAALKTHPCCAPWEGLDPIQQAKDRLFRAIVQALAWPR